MVNDPSGMLSIVIPAHNAARTIARAVRSARAIGSLQVLVVDDGSTDDTVELARMAGADVVSQERSGPAAARLRGLQLVDRPYVQFLDSDDLSRPGILQAVTMLADFPALVAVAGAMALSRESGEAVTTPGRVRDQRYDLPALLRGSYSPWPISALVWRVTAVRASSASGPPYARVQFAEDFEMLLRVAAHGEVATIPVMTCSYTVGGGRSHENATLDVRDSERVRAHYSEFYGVKVSLLSERAINDQAAWRLFFATGRVVHPLRLIRHACRRVALRLRAKQGGQGREPDPSRGTGSAHQS
jgi:glycosyltransferase involved in cell wall biosynthesis